MARMKFCISNGGGFSATEHFTRIYQRPFGKSAMIFCLFLMIPILISCGDHESTTANSRETGAIAVKLQWDENSAAVSASIPPSNEDVSKSDAAQTADICKDNGISIIGATLYNSSGTKLVPEGSWNCDAHSGKLTDVPVGSGYSLKVWGYAGGILKFKGESDGINVKANETTPVGPVQMAPLSSNQLWNIENFNGGRVQATHSGLYMSVDANGRNVVQSSAGHLWLFRTQKDAYYEIVSQNYANKCLDVESASTLPQANVQISSCGEGDHQLWSVTDYGQRYYQIRNKKSQYCLDVAANSAISGANIQQYGCKN